MPTEKQRAANRQNAQKSTGPKTPGGKYISSQNAIAHGLLAQSVLLPNESPERFRALHTSYLNTFPPDSQETLDLIETLTVARWRLRRIWTLEAANLAHEQRAQAETNQHEDPPTQTVLAVRSLSMPPRSLEALSRHESRCQRAYNQALDRLLKIQAEKQKNPARQSTKLKIVDRKPISDTNKELTLNRKPIQSLSKASTKPERTGVKPGSNPQVYLLIPTISRYKPNQVVKPRSQS